MSSVFMIKLVKKNNIEDGVVLFDLCTTPARELASELNLKYDEWVMLDKDLVNEIKEFYENIVKQNDDYIKRLEKDNNEYKELLPKCQNTDVFDTIEDRMYENNKSIMEVKEDTEIYKYREYDMTRMLDILYEIKDMEYNLFYYFA